MFVSVDGNEEGNLVFVVFKEEWAIERYRDNLLEQVGVVGNIAINTLMQAHKLIP